MINNSKREIITLIVLAITIVIFGYIVYQINLISVTLNSVLEQNSLFYEKISRENPELSKLELNNSNSGTHSNGISEQLTLSNVSSQMASESRTSGSGGSGSGSSGGQVVESRPFPYDLIHNAIATDPSTILSVVVRTAIIATLVFVIVKWLGGKGIGQLSPFGLLIVVGLGSAIGDPMLYKEISITQAMAAVIIAVIFFKVIDYLTLKSRRFRDSLEPKPILLVEHGSIVADGLKKAKMDITEFEAEMRLKGVEDVREIKYARLESNGRISFIMRKKMASDGFKGDE
ncbi:DUF421 domain-containing protein [Candidatus Nitrosocosmicus sp. T]